MSNNPYQSPNAFGASHQPVQLKTLANKIRPPAICLIVVSVVSLLVLIGSLVVDLVKYAQGIPLVEDNDLADQLGPEGTLIFRLFWFAIFFACNGIVMAGAISMCRLKSFNLSVTALVISVIPCLTPCLCLGIPFGIWGMVAIFSPGVKRAFR